MMIVLDRDRCAATGTCESIAARYFEVNDEGELDLLREDVDAGDLAEVEEAVEMCPTKALCLKS